MIHEKGLCKVLSAAYKGGGYSVIPVRRQVETVARSWRRNEIILNGATWAVRCLTEDLPKEAAVQIVKDVGYMPMEPVSVQKSQLNQTMLEDVADIRESQLEELRDGSSVMVKIPVIFRDRWRVRRSSLHSVFGAGRKLRIRSLLLPFRRRSACAGFDAGETGPKPSESGFGPERRRSEMSELCRLRRSEGYGACADADWENQVEADDPVVNLNLFNADQDEPLLTPEE